MIKKSTKTRATKPVKVTKKEEEPKTPPRYLPGSVIYDIQQAVDAHDLSVEEIAWRSVKIDEEEGYARSSLYEILGLRNRASLSSMEVVLEAMGYRLKLEKIKPSNRLRVDPKGR